LLTFSGPVTVTGGVTLDSESPNITAFTGTISGQGGFTITSSGLPTTATTGAVSFSGPNTFSGVVVVVGGSNGQNANGAVTTLAFGSGSNTIVNSRGEIVSGPFGTGQLTFFNNQRNNNPIVSGATSTILQTPDDGNDYVLANSIYVNNSLTVQ